MVELVDTQVSEACGRKAVEVQVLFRAPFKDPKILVIVVTDSLNRDKGLELLFANPGA